MSADCHPIADAARLAAIGIPIPCTASWDAMQGDERVRHCGLCRKNVYNLSAMTGAEAAALLAGSGDGMPCVRFYRRSDGTVLTSDCGTGARVRLQRAMRSLPRAAAGAVGVAGAAAMAVAVAHATPGQPGHAGPAPRVVEVALLSDPRPVAPIMGKPVFAPEPVHQMPSSGSGKRHKKHKKHHGPAAVGKD